MTMHYQPLPGDTTHQVVKLSLNGRQVIKYVGMIKLEIINCQGAWAVMHELGAFVEERGIVFIRLHHKEIRLTRACGQAEITRYAPDQKARGHACIFQNPGQQATGGGFTVGTGHGQYPFVPQQVLGQPLGARRVRQAGVEHILHHRITPGHGVANDHAIRTILQVLR